MANLDNSYKEIRASQMSLYNLVCKVPKVAVTSTPVTTVKSDMIDTELTLRRNDQEIQVFEAFFPEGDIKYMCGIRVERKKDIKTYFTYEQRRDLLPDLIKRHTDRKNAKQKASRNKEAALDAKWNQLSVKEKEAILNPGKPAKKR